MEDLVISPGFWDGRRVFLTGHTGFKGAWLALLLKSFAADTAIANANVCVVMSGTNTGNVALPAAAQYPIRSCAHARPKCVASGGRASTEEPNGACFGSWWDRLGRLRCGARTDAIRRVSGSSANLARHPIGASLERKLRAMHS